MMLAVLKSFATWRYQARRNVTVLLLAEEGVREPNLADESALADVVIRLALEPVTQTTPITRREKIAWKQDLLFCEVAKGRGLPIRRQPCCFEFVRGRAAADSGIKFYPTYAAKGVVSLFYENKPQCDVINSLRTVDVPTSYPHLLISRFTRNDLQRMYSVMRDSQRVPPRHPMMLSHVDEYWVSLLRQAGLLLPIPPDRLSLFSLPIQEGPDPADKSTRVIGELTRSKGKMYRDNDGNYLAVPQMANVGMLVYRKDLLRAIREPGPPETWEDLIRICKTLRREGKDHKLLLETQTYDTLLITALEMGWAHGALWRTRKEGDSLRIEFEDGSGPADLIAAFLRLHSLIHHDQLVPPSSTVDVKRGHNGAAELTVADDGPGLADERQVFERFYTGDAQRGAGLGLAIARELAERMNGSISTGHRNPGAAFTVTLPGDRGRPSS